MRKISDKAVVAISVSAPAESDEITEPKTTDDNQPACVVDTPQANSSTCQPPASHDDSHGHPDSSCMVTSSAPSELAGAAAQLPAESADHVPQEPAPSNNCPSGEDAAADENSPNMTPAKQEHSATDMALAVIKQANAIDRFPYNSVAADVVAKETKWFSEALPDELYTLWDNGAEAFLMSYRARCEIVYWLHKKTAKPGCSGGFHAALRRIGLKRTTGYDMVRNHAIRLGDSNDEDDSDSRDEEEQQSNGASEAPVVPPKPKPEPAPRVVLVLKDELADAIAAIQKRYDCPDAKSAVTECVLSVWRSLNMSSTPSVDRKQVLGEVAHASKAA